MDRHLRQRILLIPSASQFQVKGMQLIARHRKNIEVNTREGKNCPKTPPHWAVIGKFSNFLGRNLIHINLKKLFLLTSIAGVAAATLCFSPAYVVTRSLVLRPIAVTAGAIAALITVAVLEI
ncbi:MAG: hypothetical protein LBI69_01240 [Puniceicoccales bacterium]|jgi:hypothetical protein|nr:hypothetical protein [Puniceicoccales bacterium]